MNRNIVLEANEMYAVRESKACADEFTVMVASKLEDITKLLEVGFEYVWEKDGLLYFRKRK